MVEKVILLLFYLFLVGCTRNPLALEIPKGAEITVTLTNRAELSGWLISKTADEITVQTTELVEYGNAGFCMVKTQPVKKTLSKESIRSVSLEKSEDGRNARMTKEVPAQGIQPSWVDEISYPTDNGVGTKPGSKLAKQCPCHSDGLPCSGVAIPHGHAPAGKKFKCSLDPRHTWVEPE